MTLVLQIFDHEPKYLTKGFGIKALAYSHDDARDKVERTPVIAIHHLGTTDVCTKLYQYLYNR